MFHLVASLKQSIIYRLCFPSFVTDFEPLAKLEEGFMSSHVCMWTDITVWPVRQHIYKWSDEGSVLCSHRLNDKKLLNYIWTDTSVSLYTNRFLVELFIYFVLIKGRFFFFFNCIVLLWIFSFNNNECEWLNRLIVHIFCVYFWGAKENLKCLKVSLVKKLSL